ncbi:hypothetical protein [Galbibacter mesophilus]|uniref:hypothetical protein n=1 Tax=Galbibacter mesophilus TaxID=379069 RepID=UPI00191F6BD0|nr:hypothetical protein [Galbibacter mesophilus]MCM5663620.1 hypothetical protein [Galbibacter mesophilus]
MLLAWADLYLWGYTYIPNAKKKRFLVTYFYSGQKKALDSFMVGIPKSGLDINRFRVETPDNDENSPSFIYSEKYIDKFHSFYKFKKMDVMYTDKEDKDFYIYSGHLKISKFKTREQKLQFLKGTYIRNGSLDEEGNYILRYPHNIVPQFLESTGSRIIKIRSEELIGGAPTIIFEPSAELKELIEKK